MNGVPGPGRVQCDIRSNVGAARALAEELGGRGMANAAKVTITDNTLDHVADRVRAFAARYAKNGDETLLRGGGAGNH